jgi:ABC-type proline/glycine betaine transport system permease subunit
MAQFIVRRVPLQLRHALHPERDDLPHRPAHGRSRGLMAEAARAPRTSTGSVTSGASTARGPVQYVTFMQNAFRGGAREVLQLPAPGDELYFQRLPNSLTLGLAATLISLLIGVPAGIISAVKVNTWWDNFAKGVALLGLSIPGFWLGLVLILVFSVWLRWLPTVRGRRLAARRHARRRARMVLRRVDAPAHPLEHAGGPGQRVHQARPAQGLPDVVVIAMHAFKNALIPVFTLAGVNLVVMVNAAVIIEVIFAWPGSGRLLRGHLPARDSRSCSGRGHPGRAHDVPRSPGRGHPLRPSSTPRIRLAK